ncbi:MAG TPA: hypothetical protein PK413_11785, partial [Thermoanaerobaculia bacterium]|nr:hypothetical protein [Thermoanaerobaculia bacterium]
STAFRASNELQERLRRELVRRGIATLRLDAGGRPRWLDVAEDAALALLRPPQLSLLDEPARD